LAFSRRGNGGERKHYAIPTGERQDNGFQGSAAAHGNKSRDRKPKKKKGGKKLKRP
jgi:hypothetical protein